MRLIIKQWKLFTVCIEQVRFPYIEHAASGQPKPTRLEGGGGYDLSRLKSSRCYHTLSENGLTRSMLIKMYKFTTSGYVPVYVHCIYSQSISCRRSLSFHSNFTLLIFYLFVRFLHVCSISIIVMVKFLLWISFDLQKKRTKERKKRKKEPFVSNRELLSTRKHWTINSSLAQAHHRHYRHIAFISFQLKISTPFRKLSKTEYIAFNSFKFVFVLIYSKYHFNVLCVKIMEKWYGMRSQDVVDIMHWNCLAWQQSTSPGNPYFHHKPRNCSPPNRSLSST